MIFEYCSKHNTQAPLTSNLMKHLEESMLNKTNFPIKFFGRYVDGIITIANEKHITEILNHFFHRKLPFTQEVKKHCKINCLDITINKSNKNIGVKNMHIQTES